MNEITEIDGRTVQQIARMSGIDLSLDRAMLTAPLLKAILEIDKRIADLNLGMLTAVGTTWISEAISRDEE
jgi:hypothetical protein